METMKEKALQSQLCYEDLKKKLDIRTEDPVVFCVNDRKRQLLKACVEHNPFPSVLKPVLASLRLKAVKKLFEKEKVLQTGPAAAILSLDQVLAKDIARQRGMDVSSDPILCDITMAGLQVIRLYMMAYEGNEEFITSRYQSAIRVDNALNGSFYKYPTKDGRYFSAHVYYESQKAKMMEVLRMKKDPDKLVFTTLPADKIITRNAIRKWKGKDLEEASFANGACGCVLRERSEWEAMEVGKAVCAMPLVRMTKVKDTPKKSFEKTGKRPLSGIKVLDLTHIIAGPACTRLLAEYGADVTMIRRGKYVNQEQAMLELDGWAGKKSVSLDFNISEQLEKAKDMVKEADIIVCSYQNGALDRFGLSEEDIHQLNPNCIYASMVCFSDTVWKQRPGWAPCAEDITGLSVRNGSIKHPANLNGVPLDYIPGFILTAGILKALKQQMTEGGSYTLTGSLTRGGYWLHECTDLYEAFANDSSFTTSIEENKDDAIWQQTFHKVEGTSVGDVYFPAPATLTSENPDPFGTMKFENVE